MSRPEKPIDWAKVDQLLMAGCTGTEIAPHFDMHYETFYDRVKAKYNVGFTEYCAIKKQQGNSLLKVKQFDVALKGDKTMLVWLGKQRLGQKDAEERLLMPNDNQLNILIDEIKSLKDNSATKPKTDPEL